MPAGARARSPELADLGVNAIMTVSSGLVVGVGLAGRPVLPVARVLFELLEVVRGVVVRGLSCGNSPDRQVSYRPRRHTRGSTGERQGADMIRAGGAPARCPR